MTNFLKEKCKIKYFILPVIAVAILAMIVPSQVVAADGYKCPVGYITLQVPIPVSGQQNDFCVKGFPEYIKRIYDFFIAIVGILAVIMMMYGGFQWLIAGGNPTKISGAKATILSAMAGLCLTLSAYLILNLINPDLTQNLNLSVEEHSVKSEPGTTADGYCTKNTRLAGGLKDAFCGVDYLILGTADSRCKGAKCDKSSETCLSATTDACGSKIILPDVASQGYPTEVSVMQGSSITCGDIQWSASLAYSNLLVGQGCPSNMSCIIKTEKGYEIKKNRKENPASGEKVGRFTEAFCR